MHTNGVFVALAPPRGSTGTRLAVSHDAVQWRALSFGSFRAERLFASDGRFWAHDGRALITSTDGLAWFRAAEVPGQPAEWLFDRAGVLFLGGCLGFGIGFLRAVGRSRTETVDLAGLFYLTGSAPPEARRAFLGLWFAQIAIAAAAIPLTDPPFAVMAPVWGIGIITWWASAHATFPPREDEPRH